MCVNNPIESEIYPGFYEIPNFSRYVVSAKGVVMNKLTGKKVAGSKNPAGYHNFRLTNDVGYCYTYGRHRLLCDVFKRHTKTSSTDVVNHIDGIKGNDLLENLEWCTHQQNVEHAALTGLNTSFIPVQVRDLVTNEVFDFISVSECARALDMTPDAILHRLKSKGKRVFPEKKQYRHAHSKDVWYEPENVDNEVMFTSGNIPVLVRNLLTGKISIYRKSVELAKELGVSSAALSTWLKRSDQPVLPGMVQIKRLDDVSDWRDVVDPYREMSQFCGKRPVKVTNCETMAEEFFDSAKSCAEKYGLLQTTLNYRLKYNGNKTFDNLKFEYLF